MVRLIICVLTFIQEGRFNILLDAALIEWLLSNVEACRILLFSTYSVCLYCRVLLPGVVSKFLSTLFLKLLHNIKYSVKKYHENRKNLVLRPICLAGYFGNTIAYWNFQNFLFSYIHENIRIFFIEQRFEVQHTNHPRNKYFVTSWRSRRGRRAALKNTGGL